MMAAAPGLVAYGLAAGALLALIAARLGAGASWRWAAGLAGIAIAALPVGGLPLGAYARGVLGDPSIASQSLLLLGLASGVAGRKLVPARDWLALLLGGGLAGLALYPATFGLTVVDPYALGYRPALLAAGLAALALAAWSTGRRWTAATLVAAAAADRLGWGDGGNLWDRVTDPLLTLAALLAGVTLALRAAGRRRRRPTPPHPSHGP